MVAGVRHRASIDLQREVPSNFHYTTGPVGHQVDLLFDLARHSSKCKDPPDTLFVDDREKAASKQLVDNLCKGVCSKSIVTRACNTPDIKE